MFKLTKNARERLYRSLEKANGTKQQGSRCFRLERTAHPNFVTLNLAKPEPTDTIYEEDDVTVLAVPDDLQPILTRRLDIDDGGNVRFR
jgi:hypothetical protein